MKRLSSLIIVGCLFVLVVGIGVTMSNIKEVNSSQLIGLPENKVQPPIGLPNNKPGDKKHKKDKKHTKKKNQSKMEIPEWAKDIIKVESENNKVVTITYPWNMMEDEIDPSVTLEKFEFEVKDDEIIFTGVVKEKLGKGRIIESKGQMSVKGVLKKKLENSSFQYEGNFGIGIDSFTTMKNLDVKTVNTVRTKLIISKKGFLLKGELDMKDSVNFYAGAEFEGKVNVDAYFNHNFSNWYLDVDASEADKFMLFKVPLKSSETGAALHFGEDGIDVKAIFDLGKEDVQMEGRIDSKGFKVVGDIDVDLPLRLAGNVVDKVTDGTICGYETVTDGTICGYRTVTSATKCGTEEISDASKCGYKTVTNAEKCGEKEITSGAKCGTHKITSGAKCGWKTFSCWINPFNWGKCEKPKSCREAKSCKEPKSCKVVAECKVPKSCKDYDSPKSCQDLNKPKTCERHHLGDYVGDIRGDIYLKINQEGLKVSADAKYCAKKECDKLEADATYHAKHPMQICFDIEDLHGFKNAEGKACVNLDKLKN